MSCPSGGTRHRWSWIVVNGGSGMGWGGGEGQSYARYLDQGTKCLGGGGQWK